MVYFTDKLGDFISSVVKSVFVGTKTIMHEEQIQTSTEQIQGDRIIRAVSITKLDGESITQFEVLDAQTHEVLSVDQTLDGTLSFESNNKILIENDSNGDMVIRTRTKVTKPIIFK